MLSRMEQSCYSGTLRRLATLSKQFKKLSGVARNGNALHTLTSSRMEEQSCCSGTLGCSVSGVGFADRLLSDAASSDEEEKFQKARRLVDTSNLAGFNNFRGDESGWHAAGVTGVVVRGCSPGVNGDNDDGRCKLDGVADGKHVVASGDDC